jgi:hypothetical protein
MTKNLAMLLRNGFHKKAPYSIEGYEAKNN